jgi:hypothetical protein
VLGEIAGNAHYDLVFSSFNFPEMQVSKSERKEGSIKNEGNHLNADSVRKLLEDVVFIQSRSS